MKFLLLNGHGINMHIDGAKLHINEGRFSTSEEPQEYIFAPKRMDIDNIIIYGKDGNISIDAIRWLIKHNVQITILNWDGKLLTTMLPPESVQVKTKFAQYDAYRDSDKRLKLAKNFLESKFSRTQLVLDWLKQRYPEINTDFSNELPYLKKGKTISEIMMLEGRIARFYWQEFAKIIPEKFEFSSRVNHYSRPKGAGDMVNCMLNYGYSLLEAECLRAINSSGLDVHVGFLHEMNLGKNSLAYDLQEPFRFLVDMAVIKLIETEVMELKDFIRTENYNLRLRPTGARKVTEEGQAWFNKKVKYQGKQSSWSYVIFLKTRELAHYLIGKKKTIDFLKPSYEIERQDSNEIRKKILDISYSDWKKLGFSKGTLHYMKKNAKENKPFTLNKHVMERLGKWDQLVTRV